MKVRFAVGIAVIVAIVAYLAFVGFEEGKTYYHTCDEVAQMGSSIVDSHIKLAGRVVDGSIHRDGDILSFELEYEGHSFPVRYIGSDPVPDTFKDGVDAVVDGRLTASGVFEGRKIQAKCASKYESQYDRSQEGASAPSGSEA